MIGAIEVETVPEHLRPLMDRERISWGPLEEEPDKWFIRFHRYYLLKGTGRSVTGAWKQWYLDSYAREIEDGIKPDPDTIRQTPIAWYDAAHEFRWEQRAESFDKYDLLQDFIEWEDRRKWLREREWKLAQDMLELSTASLLTIVNEHLEAQAAAKERGLPVKKRLPLPLVMKMIGEASKLGRMASEMATSTEQIQLLMKDQDIDAVRRRRWQDAIGKMGQLESGEIDLSTPLEE